MGENKPMLGVKGLAASSSLLWAVMSCSVWPWMIESLKVNTVSCGTCKSGRDYDFSSPTTEVSAFCVPPTEPRGCPETLSHTVGMSESPIGPKSMMLRADAPSMPSFQQAFASSCTVSSNSPGQRREG